jgi:hypothetical protein
LQAVAANDADGLGRIVLVLTATVKSSKPPEIDNAAVEILPIDWESIDDRCALALQLEKWWRDYELRPGDFDQPYEDAPRSVGWFGSPDSRTYRDVPNGWESQIRALAAILGMRIHLSNSPHEAAAQSVHERVDFAVALNGTHGWDVVRSHFDSLEKDLLDCGSPGSDFDSLLAAARRVLIPYVMDCIEPDPLPPCELTPGVAVYHRKISPQPRNYDRFDAGSPSPCIHGADSFERWSGDKAVKGMQRIYSNFDPKMLYHCSKFPRCGVYAVKA